MVAPLLVAGGTLLAGEMLRNKGDAGEGALKAALAQFSGIKPPTIEELRAAIQNAVYQGDISPDEANAVLQDPSKMNEIMTSGMGRSAQFQALEKLQGISTGGGMTAEDRAALDEIQSSNAQDERGARGAIMQNARERGVGGSGLELAAALENQQGSASRASKSGLDVAAQAQKRALEAILASGTLGGQVQGQEFSEGAQKATAQDAIARFNAANRQDVINRNVAARNEAMARNAGEKQRISDVNTSIANEKSKADAAARQTVYENELKKAAGMSGQLKNIADSATANQNNNNAAQGQLIGAGGTIIGKFAADKQAEDEKKKKESGGYVQ